MANENRRLFDELGRLTTEQQNPRTQRIDEASALEIVQMINREDALVAAAVKGELEHIAKAIDILVAAFRSGGRLFYVGAGTSGRLGILDASECPPTFGTDPGMVQGIIAGGPDAVVRSIEGAEDRPADGAAALDAVGVTAQDVVCGIAASRRTPFVVGAVNRARDLGCKTLFVTCTPRSSFDLDVTVPICVDVGPEAIMGSTRMKSGTAQKMVLNMLTTASMILLGKTYENMMVDLQMTNEKLLERSRRILMMVAGIPYERAADVLSEANGHVKTALVMLLGDLSKDEAVERLAVTDGHVRAALATEGGGS